jgi:hypothetical protein
MKRSALHSSHLADHRVRPAVTLVAQLVSPFVAPFAGGFLGCLVTLQSALCQVLLDHTDSAMLVGSVLPNPVRRHFWRNDLGYLADQQYTCSFGRPYGWAFVALSVVSPFSSPPGSTLALSFRLPLDMRAGDRDGNGPRGGQARRHCMAAGELAYCALGLADGPGGDDRSAHGFERSGACLGS